MKFEEEFFKYLEREYCQANLNANVVATMAENFKEINFPDIKLNFSRTYVYNFLKSRGYKFQQSAQKWVHQETIKSQIDELVIDTKEAENDDGVDEL